MTVNNLTRYGFKVEHRAVVACNGSGLKNILRAGQQWLEAHREIVNNLNVFPVPDGDTGTNMLLTMRAALAEVDRAAGETAGAVALAAAQGALMGARGNSGVILSQFLQGMANSLQGRITFDAQDLARATRAGAEKAYQSVVEPVEGTILTVARAVAAAARQSAALNHDLLGMLAHIVEAAKAAQAATPELLPVLKQAGVTDSGGQGMVYILEGGLRLMRNEPLHAAAQDNPSPRIWVAPPPAVDGYGYDVQFLIHGQNLDVEQIRAHIDTLGQSTVVVGNRHTVKVHVHTPEPARPLNYGAGLGVLSDVVVENLTEQARTFANRAVGAEALPAQIAVVSVVPGNGLARIFQSLGAGQVVMGGQTMNPSPQALLDAAARLPAGQVIILPNNANVILAARQAAALSKKEIRVVPTKTTPQGIAALLSFNVQANLETNIRRMEAAAAQTRTIEITRAVHSRSFNREAIRAGDVIGLVDNELAAVGGSEEAVILSLLGRTATDADEIVTIYFGRESSPEQAEALAGRIKATFPALDVEVYEGGQPHYPYIIALE